MHTHTTPTRRGALTTALLLAALIMLTAALPAAASAQVRSITRTFAPATERPSLEPRAPLTQREELPQSITVSYDQAAGVLAAHVAIYDAAIWNSRLPHMDINLGSDCENLDQVKAWAEYERYGDSDDEIENAAVLSISGYAGQSHGSITPTPDGFDLSIQHPALAGRDLRCVEINGNLIAGPMVPEGPVLAYFDGYQPVEPVQLTKRNATGLFKQQLAGRYGSAFTGASQFWVKCPSQEFFTDGFNDDGYQSALCTAQFKSHGRWRLVSASINQTDDGPVMAKPFTRTWTRRWTREGAKCARAAGVKGRISSNYGACESLMIGDLKYSVARHERIRYAYEHGTNTAGFEEVMRYRCKQHGRTITCTNKLGDAFRWIRLSAGRRAAGARTAGSRNGSARARSAAAGERPSPVRAHTSTVPMPATQM